jgi:hypothetical protein
MLTHRDIHKHTWTSPDRKTNNKIDHVFIDKRQHTDTDEVRSFRLADRDTDHYLVVAKFRKRLSVSKQAEQKFDTERFNLKTKGRGSPRTVSG